MSAEGASGNVFAIIKFRFKRKCTSITILNLTILTYAIYAFSTCGPAIILIRTF